jgi:hypothetical protein
VSSRDLSYGWGWVWFIAAFLCLIGLNFAAGQSELLAVVVLKSRKLSADAHSAGTLRYQGAAAGETQVYDPTAEGSRPPSGSRPRGCPAA